MASPNETQHRDAARRSLYRRDKLANRLEAGQGWTKSDPTVSLLPGWGWADTHWIRSRLVAMRGRTMTLDLTPAGVGVGGHSLDLTPAGERKMTLAPTLGGMKQRDASFTGPYPCWPRGFPAQDADSQMTGAPVWVKEGQAAALPLQGADTGVSRGRQRGARPQEKNNTGGPGVRKPGEKAGAGLALGPPDVARKPAPCHL